jgi:hypothetical protein
MIVMNPGCPACYFYRMDTNKPQDFFPSGAIAFFILLVILCLAVWFGIYILMLKRS